MPLTREFKETVLREMQTDRGFAEAMLREGIDAFLAGEMELGKEILRDYINATIGFEKLGRKVGLPPKSLIRMFGPTPKPKISSR